MVVTQKTEPEIKIDDLETERTQQLKQTGNAKPYEPLWAVGKYSLGLGKSRR